MNAIKGSGPVLSIRPERPEDAEIVRRINLAAFGQEGEADLVDRLREAGQAVVALVAEQDEETVGHILFSPVTVEPGCPSLRALGLAPMAVLPGFQRRGVGSALVREGLAACGRMGYGAVVVLGHPEYYPRFGFVPASRFGLACEYPVPDEVFMALELRPGALQGCRGLVRYREEFAEV